MRNLRKILSALFLLFLCDFHFTPLSVLIFFYINIFPELTFRKTSTVRNKILEDGVCLLELFLVTVIAAPACFLISMWFDKTSLPDDSSAWLALLPKLLLWSVSEAILFWNGILRVYLTSVQLGIKWRIIGILCGWIPVVHIWALCKIIHITSAEVQCENEKYLLSHLHDESDDGG